MDRPKLPTGGMQGFGEEGSPDDWDLSIGEIYGYRWWKIILPASFAGYTTDDRLAYITGADGSLGGGSLIGANSQSWEPGVIEAKCTSYRRPVVTWYELLKGISEPVEHEPPETRTACGCGFWAYFDPASNVTAHFGNLGTGKAYKTGNYMELPVFGVIKGSGRVVVGEKGFRSQYAEIVSLCVPEITQTQLSWWTRPRHVADNRFGEIRKTSFYEAAMAGNLTETWEVSPTEHLARLGTLEAILGDMYPDAKIFSDRSAMVGYYPPDKTYS